MRRCTIGTGGQLSATSHLIAGNSLVSRGVCLRACDNFKLHIQLTAVPTASLPIRILLGLVTNLRGVLSARAIEFSGSACIALAGIWQICLTVQTCPNWQVP